jgi:hypothetical protein
MYKIIAEGVEIEGIVQSIDTQVELTEEVAAPLLEAGQIELVVEVPVDEPTAPVDVPVE